MTSSRNLGSSRLTPTVPTETVPAGPVVSTPQIPDESAVGRVLTQGELIERALQGPTFQVLQPRTVPQLGPVPGTAQPQPVSAQTRLRLEQERGAEAEQAFGRGLRSEFGQAFRSLRTIRLNPFTSEENVQQKRLDELRAIQKDRPPPESIPEAAGRIVGAVATLGASSPAFTADELADDTLMSIFMGVPGGAMIGSPAMAALGPFSKAVVIDSNIAKGQFVKRIRLDKAGLAFDDARIVPQASDFAATTRTIDDVMARTPNQTKGISSPASTDPTTGQLREVLAFERPRGGIHGQVIGGPLGPTQRTPEFVVPRVITDVETKSLSDIRTPLKSGTSEFKDFKKFMVDHSDVLNEDIGRMHVAFDGTFEFMFGTYLNPRRPGGDVAERMYVMFDPTNGGRYRITAAIPENAPFGTVTPGDIDIYAKASKDIFGDVMGEAIAPLRETTSPFMATTINSPEIPSSTVDNILENIEAAIAKSRIGTVGPRVRRPGSPLGLDMNTPSPRSPHTALLDDLEIPTHEKPLTGIQRKWEGARDAEGLAASNFFKRGNNLMKGQGVTDFTAETMRPLFRALHGELEVRRLSPELRVIYQDVKAYMKAEEADMVNFLNSVKSSEHSVWLALDAENFATRMMAHPDYFPRGWKQPPSPAAAGGAGRGNLGRTPSFKRARVDATFTEMLKSGMEPASWNPYAMVTQRRLTGVEYRESVTLLNRMRVQGLTHAVTDPRDIPQGFRVPKAGPVFEGRPIPSKTPGHFETTRPVAVPNQMANFLESSFGTAFDNNVVRFTRKWSNRAKSLKLITSLFQHVDFATRGGATAFSLTGISRGAPLKLPSLGGRLIRTQFSRDARDKLAAELVSGKSIAKGRDISYRMIIEEGWSIRGDLSLIRREFTNFMNSPEVSRNLVGKSLANLRKANDFWQEGLFDGVYRESQKFALDEFILPWLLRTRKGASDRVIAAEAAEIVNVMYSTLGNWQTVLKNPHLKEFAHTLMFSTNESEALIRSGLSAVTVQHNSGLFREWYLGAFVFLAASANAINFAAKGEPLKKEQYIPINFDDPYASWFGIDTGIGYDSQFLSPVVPLIKGRNGQDVHLDTVGQLDTVFRWALNPTDAATARVNVIPRAGYNQVKGETFNRTKLDTPKERVVQLALDLGAPISAGSALEAAREFVPGLADLIPEQEGRLGVPGNLVQAAGLNLRGQATDQILEIAALDKTEKSYRELTPKQRNDIKNLPGVAEELSKRNEVSLNRELPLALYFNKRDDINESYRNEEGTGLIDELATDEGMGRDFRNRLGELHSQRRTQLQAHDETDESSEAREMLENTALYTSEVDKANTTWNVLFDQTNPESGAPGLEDPVTGEWNFKLAEQYRKSMVAEFGEETVAAVEVDRRRRDTAFEAHLWATRDILSDNYWILTDTEMANSGLTELYDEYTDNRQDKPGFLKLHPEVNDAINRANEQKRAFRQGNPAMERLMWAWGYIDTPQSEIIRAEVLELRDRQGGVIEDRSSIFEIAEFFGNEVLLGAP